MTEIEKEADNSSDAQNATTHSENTHRLCSEAYLSGMVRSLDRIAQMTVNFEDEGVKLFRKRE